MMIPKNLPVRFYCKRYRKIQLFSRGHEPALTRFSVWFDKAYFIIETIYSVACCPCFFLPLSFLSRLVQWGSVSTPLYFQHTTPGRATLLRHTSTSQTLGYVSLFSRSSTSQSLSSCSTYFANWYVSEVTFLDVFPSCRVGFA